MREGGREGDRDLLQTWQHVLRLSSLIKAADLQCLYPRQLPNLTIYWDEPQQRDDDGDKATM